MFRRVLVFATALCTIAAPRPCAVRRHRSANLVQTTLMAYRVNSTTRCGRSTDRARMAQRPRPRSVSGLLLPDSHDPSVGLDGRGFRRSIAATPPALQYSTALPLLRQRQHLDAERSDQTRCCCSVRHRRDHLTRLR
jgi:hypothetical protein